MRETTIKEVIAGLVRNKWVVTVYSVLFAEKGTRKNESEGAGEGDRFGSVCVEL